MGKQVAQMTPYSPTASSKNRQIIIIAGSNRTGTSLLTEILIKKGFKIPAGNEVVSQEYTVYESEEFKNISRNWNWNAARKFAAALPDGKIVLKYPKSSYVLKKWLKVIPDAKTIYVFRPMNEAVESQLKNWWRNKPFKSILRLIYRIEWLLGYLAMRNISTPIAFISFEELKTSQDFVFPEYWEWS